MSGNHIMSISKILTDLCLIKLKIKIRNIFVSAASNVFQCLIEHKKRLC